MKAKRLAVPLVLAAAALCLLRLPAESQTMRRGLKVSVKDCPKPPILLNGPETAKSGETITLTWTARGEYQYRLDGIGAVANGSAQVSPPCCGPVTYTLRGVNECGDEVASGKTINVKKPKVYLSGSRFSSGWSVAAYIMSPGMFCPQCYGNTAPGFVNAHATAQQKAGYNEFMARMAAWPPTVEAFKTAHVGGNTYIVDENGGVLGSMPTMSIFDTGVPGLSYLGDPFNSSGSNKIFVGNASLSHKGVDYDVIGFLSASPIILDLDDDGKPDVDRGEWLPHPARFNRSRALLFDISAIGFPNITEWIGPKDGLLVAPLKPGETVKGGENLFGNPIGFVDGYQKLGLHHDKDGNGAVEGPELEGFSVWQDLDQNGLAEPGELRSVRELGVTSISTGHENLKGSFVMGGIKRPTWDWWPTSMVVYPSVQAGAK